MPAIARTAGARAWHALTGTAPPCRVPGAYPNVARPTVTHPTVTHLTVGRRRDVAPP